MYRYIKGLVTESDSERVVIEAGGIGYELTTSQTTNQQLRVGEMAKLYVKLIVKEDEHSLCGFYDEEEGVFFEHLVSVSGIGKRVAMGILSAEGFPMIISHIIKGDDKALSKLPGLGKKTSQRLVVELQDRLKKAYGDQSEWLHSDTHPSESLVAQDDIHLALTALGFKRDEIALMLKGLDVQSMSVEEAIKYALTNRR